MLKKRFHQGEDAEQALEDIILIAKESAENRRKLKEGGVIPLVLGLWRRNLKSRTHLRSEAISALRYIAIASQENKVQKLHLSSLITF